MIKDYLKSIPSEDLIIELNSRGFQIPLNPSEKKHKQSDVTKKTLRTLGAKEKEFSFDISGNKLIIYRTRSGIKDVFEIGLLLELLYKIKAEFGIGDDIPLANNVELLGRGLERPGFGSFIYGLTHKNIYLAQAASQLVALLFEAQILHWNGAKRGMKFQLMNVPANENELILMLKKVQDGTNKSSSNTAPIEVEGYPFISLNNERNTPNIAMNQIDKEHILYRNTSSMNTVNDFEYKAPHFVVMNENTLNISLSSSQKFNEDSIVKAIDDSRIGIIKYRNIMNNVLLRDVAIDKQFRTDYNAFYRVRQRSQAWYQFYYSYMQSMKHTQLSFADALRHFHKNLNRMEPSFISKLIHTLDPNKPIWDQYVLTNLGLKRPDYNDIDRVIYTYNEIESWFDSFKQSDQGKLCIALFEREVAMASEISDVKRIDFILWQSR